MPAPEPGRSRSAAEELGNGIVRRMLWFGLLGAIPFVLERDLPALGILTLIVAVSIFHLRGLQAQVLALHPVWGSSSRARALVSVLFRYLLLAAGLILILYVDVSRPAALIIGVSILPAALLAEALVQVKRRRAS